MWETNDKKNYLYHLKNNKGQICNDSFSKEIIIFEVAVGFDVALTLTR